MAHAPRDARPSTGCPTNVGREMFGGPSPGSSLGRASSGPANPYGMGSVARVRASADRGAVVVIPEHPMARLATRAHVSLDRQLPYSSPDNKGSSRPALRWSSALIPDKLEASAMACRRRRKACWRSGWVSGVSGMLHPPRQGVRVCGATGQAVHVEHSPRSARRRPCCPILQDYASLQGESTACWFCVSKAPVRPQAVRESLTGRNARVSWLTHRCLGDRPLCGYRQQPLRPELDPGLPGK
jgi:hypothetical protein